MTHVVTADCRLCRFTDCVEVCPVDCFHGDGEMLYIDPAICIDCGVCVPACPVEAIFDEGSLPDEYSEWQAMNAERAPHLPVVRVKEPPLPGAHALALERGKARSPLGR